MISDKSFEELCEHIEYLRRMAWTMHMDSDGEEAHVWRGKQFAYEHVLREIDRRKRMEGVDATPR